MPKVTVLTEGQSAELDPKESGFAHGFGIFETMKLAAGRLYLFDAHWHRFMCSADALGLDCEASAADVLAGIKTLVETDGLLNAVIKLSLLREGNQTQLFVYSRPSHVCPKSISLKFCTDAPINESSPLAGHKTHNYMENLLLLLKAKSEGYSDVLRVNTVGELAETTVGNFFFIRDGRLHTPSLRCGVLPGTRRGLVLQLAHDMKIEVIKGSFGLDALNDMDGAFVTNASVGVLPVHRLMGAGVEYAAPETLPVITELSHALSDYEIEHRIDI